MKPIASNYTPEEAKDCTAIAEHQALEDAVNFDIFMCGMQPLVEGSPCHDIFQCYPGLTCATPVESSVGPNRVTVVGGSRRGTVGPYYGSGLYRTRLRCPGEMPPHPGAGRRGAGIKCGKTSQQNVRYRSARSAAAQGARDTTRGHMRANTALEMVTTF